EERRAFLQVRVALFGKLLAVFSAGFLLAPAASYFLLPPPPPLATRPSLARFHPATIAPVVPPWAGARRGTPPRPAVHLLEARATILPCVGYAVMSRCSTSAW